VHDGARILGSIQPHDALLTLDPDTHTLTLPLTIVRVADSRCNLEETERAATQRATTSSAASSR
jgi:hypothetical protein